MTTKDQAFDLMRKALNICIARHYDLAEDSRIGDALAAAKAVGEAVNCDECVYHYKDTNQKPCNTCVHSQEFLNNFEPRNQVAKAVSEKPAQPVQGLQPVVDALTIEQLNSKVERLMAAQPTPDADPNAPWLTEAHILCTEQGIPQGHISWRIGVLRELLSYELQRQPSQAGELSDEEAKELWLYEAGKSGYNTHELPARFLREAISAINAKEAK